MRIVDRKTFLALPAGTLFAKFGDTEGSPGHFYFGEVRIKDHPRGESDWYSVGFTDGFTDAANSTEYFEVLESAVGGEEIEIDFDTLDSDGLYDDRQLFAVFSLADTEAMIARLNAALAKQRVAAAVPA